MRRLFLQACVELSKFRVLGWQHRIGIVVSSVYRARVASWGVVSRAFLEGTGDSRVGCYCF